MYVFIGISAIYAVGVLLNINQKLKYQRCVTNGGAVMNGAPNLCITNQNTRWQNVSNIWDIRWSVGP